MLNRFEIRRNVEFQEFVRVEAANYSIDPSGNFIMFTKYIYSPIGLKVGEKLIMSITTRNVVSITLIAENIKIEEEK